MQKIGRCGDRSKGYKVQLYDKDVSFDSQNQQPKWITI